MKTLYRIYEFLFDRWKWELNSKREIDVYNGNDKMPYKTKVIYTYKLTDKFDGSIKYATKKHEI